MARSWYIPVAGMRYLQARRLSPVLKPGRLAALSGSAPHAAPGLPTGDGHSEWCMWDLWLWLGGALSSGALLQASNASLSQAVAGSPGCWTAWTIPTVGASLRPRASIFRPLPPPPPAPQQRCLKIQLRLLPGIFITILSPASA